MPTTRKQKKARKSREVDMLSDIENLHVMLGDNHLEREESEISNHGRRPESPSYDTLLNQNGNSHPHSHETEIRTYVRNGHSSKEADSGGEFNRLSGVLNQRITMEMSDITSTVSSQIQRAINVSISVQILPQIQSTLKFGHGHMPERRWEDPVRRLECRSEEALDRRFKSDSRDECYRFPNRNEVLQSTHDTFQSKTKIHGHVHEQWIGFTWCYDYCSCRYFEWTLF